jgi:hypothetical protein
MQTRAGSPNWRKWSVADNRTQEAAGTPTTNKPGAPETLEKTLTAKRDGRNRRDWGHSKDSWDVNSREKNKSSRIDTRENWKLGKEADNSMTPELVETPVEEVFITVGTTVTAETLTRARQQSSPMAVITSPITN